MKKVAIVTGAAGDIGCAIVKRFIKDDVFTIGWDIDSEGLGQNSPDLDEKSYRSSKCELTCIWL